MAAASRNGLIACNHGRKTNVNRNSVQLYPNLRAGLRVTGFVLGVLLSAPVLAQSKIGDWAYWVEREASQEKLRIALSGAQAYVGNEPKPKLVIRREASADKIELLIIDTHDADKDKCEYKDWKLSIDDVEIGVLGYTFEPSKTLLKAAWGSSQEDLWTHFRKGLNLALQAEQRCDSSLEARMISYPFSLRGSSAVLKFVGTVSN